MIEHPISEESLPEAIDPRDLYQTYMQDHVKLIDGWFSERFCSVLDVVHSVQEELGIRGNAGEIGVHHGKFFIALHNMTRAGEKSVAFDVFEDQDLNPDHSGLGDRSVFLGNVEKYGRSPKDVVCVKGDSLSLNAGDIARICASHGRFRLFSIDGSHTVQHTAHDFHFAQEVLEDGGVIFLDDYYSPHWPGVHEAITKAFHCGVPKVAPFLFAYNKLMLTSYHFHARYHERARQDLQGIEGFKETTYLGFPVITL